MKYSAAPVSDDEALSNQESFFSHLRFLWLWISLGIVSLSLIVYSVSDPIGGHSGGTALGYALGILSTLIMIQLMAYGLRKRAFQSTRTTVKGWLSAHVWMGLSLLVLVPLHAGLHFHFNFHGLALVLTVVVVVSGLWGAVHYQRLAPLIGSHRGEQNLRSLIEDFQAISERLRQLVDTKTEVLEEWIELVGLDLPRRLWVLLMMRVPRGLTETEVAGRLERYSESDRSSILMLIEATEKQRDILKKMQRELRISAQLKLWLLIHLPLSVALMAVVCIHIGVVLFYR